nr:bifunctional nicotinamide-nucleotide adenylyltransferase/Nudix hydroxylase [Dechloromonas sp.]
MSHEFDVAVLIGRFQPFHNGHAALLATALDKAAEVVVVLGSAHAARNARNPFTWEERAAMIGASLNEAQRERVSFLPQRDCYDDRRWAAAVAAAVGQAVAPGARVALIGHLKDASSDYLKRFPGWSFIPVHQQGEIDATALRRIFFEGEETAAGKAATQALLGGLVPPAVLHYLLGWAGLAPYALLRAEHAAIEESRRIWGSGPFITVDAVVTAAGHVLLVERGRAPGKGLWALPGGFLDGRERVVQGAIRELREETGFALLDAELEGALKGVAVFDHPDRSARGRTITHAHYFALECSRLPEVAGADDAASAFWLPIGELAANESRLFEDHFNILDHFLGLGGPET